MTDCCNPCSTPTVPPVAVPGSPGLNSISIVTADFVVPAVNGTVTVAVDNSSWMVLGQAVVVGQGVGNALANPGPATFIVSAVPSSSAVTLRFANYGGDVAAGSSISQSAIITAGYSGSSFIKGSATLVAGTVTVTAAITSTSNIQVTRKTTGGALGNLSVPSANRIVAAGTFVINSSSGTETSTVDYLIIG